MHRPVPGPPLQFVVGKGGVGKSVITAALGLCALRRSRRVLVAEFGGPGGLARFFAANPPPAVPVEVRPGLHLAYFDGETALAEYLRLVVPIRRLLSTVLTSRLYRYFVAAAPGLKELMTVGKVWYEHQRTVDGGEKVWDAIVVDAGASGHSIQYLQMPSTAAGTFGSGLVHRESERIESLLKDQASTAVHVVATPEEMPLMEARQILERLRESLDLPIGTVFVNRCRELAPAGVDDAIARLADLDLHGCGLAKGERSRLVREGLRATATRSLGWQRLQEDGIARFEAAISRRVTRLPLLASEEFGLREIEKLAAVIADGEGGESG